MSLGEFPRGWQGSVSDGNAHFAQVLAIDFQTACTKLAALGVRDFHTVRELKYDECIDSIKEQWADAGEDEMRMMRAEALGHYE
jgi:hypothetical protein